MKVLRMKDLPGKVGLSEPQIFRMIEKGEFPKPFKLTERATGWRDDVIDAWIEARSAVPADAAH